MSFNAKEFLKSLYETQTSSDLPSEWLEEFEERAAILEYDGHLPRNEAEKKALMEIVTRIKDIEEYKKKITITQEST